MKVVAINGSPRMEGNTHLALKQVSDSLAGCGIDVEILHIGDKSVRGCIGCYGCSRGAKECVLADDDFRCWTNKMYEADGIILGSPVYYAGMAGTLKCFLDRAFFQSRGRMKNKIGAGIAICRRTGGMTTFEQLNAYFLISEMIVAPSFYWNVGHGMEKGEILKDAEALCTLEQLSSNFAWLLSMKESTKDTIPIPETVSRARMNFIR